MQATAANARACDADAPRARLRCDLGGEPPPAAEHDLRLAFRDTGSPIVLGRGPAAPACGAIASANRTSRKTALGGVFGETRGAGFPSRMAHAASLVRRYVDAGAAILARSVRGTAGSGKTTPYRAATIMRGARAVRPVARGERHARRHRKGFRPARRPARSPAPSRHRPTSTSAKSRLAPPLARGAPVLTHALSQQGEPSWVMT